MPLFLMAVIVSTWAGGARAGLLATVLSLAASVALINQGPDRTEVTAAVTEIRLENV